MIKYICIFSLLSVMNSSIMNLSSTDYDAHTILTTTTTKMGGRKKEWILCIICIIKAPRPKLEK